MTCVICCESIPDDEKERLIWPTCNHVFHKVCAMNACQYSIKCPMCNKTCEYDYNARTGKFEDLAKNYSLIAVMEKMSKLSCSRWKDKLSTKLLKKLESLVP